jgi:dUTPase
MVLSNCEPTIDEGYTGEVSAVFYHVLEDMPIYEVGKKVLQMKIGVTFDIDFDEVDFKEFKPTDRASNGYGSSGK